jgi:peptide/nickel transport system substrate-binding protein
MLNNEHPPFDDIRARQALAYATDREQYVELLGYGVFDVAESMFAPGTKFFSELDNFPDHDVEQAQELAADYCSDNPDQCNGDKIKFEYATTPSPENESVYDTLAQQWDDVAEISKTPIEQAQFIQTVALGAYDAVLWRQFGAVDPDSDMLWLDSESIGAISLNFARHADDQIDEWLDEQRVSQDFEERKELWRNINERLNERVPYIWLNHTVWGIVAEPEVQGIVTPTLVDGETIARPLNNGRIEVAQLWLAQ